MKSLLRSKSVTSPKGCFLSLAPTGGIALGRPFSSPVPSPVFPHGTQMLGSLSISWRCLIFFIFYDTGAKMQYTKTLLKLTELAGVSCKMKETDRVPPVGRAERPLQAPTPANRSTS